MKTSKDEKFFKKVQDFCLKNFEEYVAGGEMKMSRGHWTGPGGTLDGILEDQRLICCRISQEAARRGRPLEDGKGAVTTDSKLVTEGPRTPG